MPDITLADLRIRAAKFADVVVSATGRHKTDWLDARINEALGSYQSCLVDAGHPQRETRTTATTSSSTTSSNGWPANEYVALPTDFLILRSAKVLQNSREWQLSPAPEIQSEISTQRYQTGFPEFYRISRDSNNAQILRLMPPADAAYTIVIVYTPMLTELADEADTYEFYPGTSDYVTCDAALALLEADGVQEGNQYQALQQRKAEAMQRIKEYAHMQNRGGPAQMVDVRRKQRRLGWR